MYLHSKNLIIPEFLDGRTFSVHCSVPRAFRSFLKKAKISHRNVDERIWLFYHLKFVLLSVMLWGMLRDITRKQYDIWYTRWRKLSVIQCKYFLCSKIKDSSSKQIVLSILFWDITIKVWFCFWRHCKHCAHLIHLMPYTEKIKF